MSYELDHSVILNYISRWPLIIFLLSAMFCFGCSAIFHLFFIQSSKVMEILSRLDYGGISILVMGSAYPPLFYGYACQETLFVRNIFLVIVTLSCSFCFFASLHPLFSQPKYRAIRSSMFVVLGISAASPLFYIHFQTDQSPFVDDFRLWPWI